ELGSFPVASYEVEAWEEGTVGWASVKETITSSGASFDGRATYVLHLEPGEAERGVLGSGVDAQPRGARTSRSAREARPIGDARLRGDGDDRLHRHRRLHRLAPPPRFLFRGLHTRAT